MLNKQSYESNNERGDCCQLGIKRRLKSFTNKYHYITEITLNWSNVMSCTLHGLKADIMHLMNMSQHKRFAFVNWTMWRNDYIIAMG